MSRPFFRARCFVKRGSVADFAFSQTNDPEQLAHAVIGPLPFLTLFSLSHPSTLHSSPYDTLIRSLFIQRLRPASSFSLLSHFESDPSAPTTDIQYPSSLPLFPTFIFSESTKQHSILPRGTIPPLSLSSSFSPSLLPVPGIRARGFFKTFHQTMRSTSISTRLVAWSPFFQFKLSTRLSFQSLFSLSPSLSKVLHPSCLSLGC